MSGAEPADVDPTELERRTRAARERVSARVREQISAGVEATRAALARNSQQRTEPEVLPDDGAPVFDYSKEPAAHGLTRDHGTPAARVPTSPPPADSTQEPARVIRLRSAAEIIANPTKASWLIRDVLEQGVLAIAFGDLGTYKSFLALDWALHLASGKPWLGGAFKTRQAATVYISAEGRGLDKRIRGWARHHQVDTKGLPFYAVEHLLDLSTVEGINDLVTAIEALGITPELIVVDTLSRNCGPLDENTSSDMAGFLNRLDELLRVRFGCTVLLVHHVGHSSKERTRGSYALLANTDASYRVERPDLTEKVIRITTGRLKDSESHEPLYAMGKIIDLGTFDDDGRPESTLVLVPTHSRPQAAQKPGGKRQAQLLEYLESEYRSGNTTWSAGEIMKIAQKPPMSMHRNTAREAWLALSNSGFLKPTIGGSTLKEPPA